MCNVDGVDYKFSYAGDLIWMHDYEYTCYALCYVSTSNPYLLTARYGDSPNNAILSRHDPSTGTLLQSSTDG